jgi:hypothetical protein
MTKTTSAKPPRRVTSRRGAAWATAVLAAGAIATGCSSPLEPLPTGAPAEFEFTMAGVFVGSATWSVRGDTIMYARASWDTGESYSAKVVPAADDWTAFWDAVDAAGVRRWQRRYEARPVIMDGVGWQLRIGDGRLSIRSEGSNSYPDRHGRKHDGEPTIAFQLFLDALQDLSGYAFNTLGAAVLQVR